MMTNMVAIIAASCLQSLEHSRISCMNHLSWTKDLFEIGSFMAYLGRCAIYTCSHKIQEPEHFKAATHRMRLPWKAEALINN